MNLFDMSSKAALHTGGVVQCIMASLQLRATDSQSRLVAWEDPTFAGHCLDAPAFIPSGSVRHTGSGTGGAFVSYQSRG